MPDDSAPRTKYLRPASVERTIVAVEGGEHVEREALQLEADIERDEVGGRDHQHHAEHGEDDQHRELEAAELLAHQEALAHDQHERGAGEHEHLGEAREVVDRRARR